MPVQRVYKTLTRLARICRAYPNSLLVPGQGLMTLTRLGKICRY
jgi:hypothetical protein